MRFKSFFKCKRSVTALDTGLEQPRSIEHTASSANSTRSRSRKLAHGVRAVFNIHRRDKAGVELVTDAASHIITDQSRSDMTVAAKAMEPEHVFLPTPTSSSTVGESTMASTPSAGSPSTTATSVAPDLKGDDNSTQQDELISALDALHDAEKKLQQRHAMMKVPIQAEASRKPSPFTTLINKAKPSAPTTSPTAPSFVTSDVESTGAGHNDTISMGHAEASRKPSPFTALIIKSNIPSTTRFSASPEDFVTKDAEATTAINNSNKTHQEHADTKTHYQTAIQGLNEASKVLEQRQAMIKLQPEPTSKTPRKTSGLGALIQKKRVRPDPTDDGHAVITTQQVTPNSPRKSAPPQPTHAPLPSSRNRKQPETANAACASVHRRHLIKKLAYRAVHGCDEALDAFDQLNDHLFAQSRGERVGDLCLNFDGVHVFASQLLTVERTWLSRLNAVLKLQGLADRKMMSVEDHEIIQNQMFPHEKRDLMDDQCFEILMNDLGMEGSKYCLIPHATYDDLESKDVLLTISQSSLQVKSKPSLAFRSRPKNSSPASAGPESPRNPVAHRTHATRLASPYSISRRSRTVVMLPSPPTRASIPLRQRYHTISTSSSKQHPTLSPSGRATSSPRRAPSSLRSTMRGPSLSPALALPRSSVAISAPGHMRRLGYSSVAT